MDFIRQMKGFQRKRRACPISAGAISLYLALFETANDLHFPENFTAVNTVLQGSAMLSGSSFRRAREELINCGYLRYEKSQGRSCGRYFLIPLDEEQPDILGHQNEGDSGGKPAEADLERQNGPSFRQRNDGEMNTFNNYNYNLKQTDESAPAQEKISGGQRERALEEIANCWRQQIGEPPRELRQAAEGWLEEQIEPGLICKAVCLAKEARMPVNYVRTVVQDWKRQGICSLAVYRAVKGASGNSRGGSSGVVDCSFPRSYDLAEVEREILAAQMGGGKRNREKKGKEKGESV